ncbi:MAG: tetratricopeptide repeat protein [Nitrospirota bacterium]
MASTPGSTQPPVSTNDTIELAITYAKERQYDEALHYFHRATAFTPEALSYFGLALAMRRQRLDDALELCRQAIDRDPIRADLYFNLGQVHLAREDKKLAVRAFWQGLRVEPSDARLIAALRQLGVRQRPLIEGLARANPINRCLGWVRHRMKKTVSR